MSTKVTESYVCDDCESELDSKPSPTNVGYQGKVYALDLCNECADTMDHNLFRVIENGTEVGRYPAKAIATPAPKKQRKQGAIEASVIRQWAAEQGIEVGAKGRVPQAIVDKYLGSLNGHSRKTKATASA